MLVLTFSVLGGNGLGCVQVLSDLLEKFYELITVHTSKLFHRNSKGENGRE